MIIADKNRKSCLFKRQFLFQAVRAFNDPESEYFAGVDQVVFVTQFLTDLFCLISRISCDDSVNQCGAENVFFLHPVFEIISQFPLVNILKDAFFQFFSIVINQLTGKNDETFAFLSSKILKTLI